MVSHARRLVLIAALASVLPSVAALASATCPDEQANEIPAPDPKFCESLEADMRRPSAFRLDVYEGKLKLYLGAMCHRNTKAGWWGDRRIRDVGPCLGTYRDGKRSGQGFGTHA